MSPLAAAVCVFWGVVVLAVVRMLVSYKRSADASSQVSELRKELAELDVKRRLDSLESGQKTLSNKVESAKVSPINRRGWSR